MEFTINTLSPRRGYYLEKIKYFKEITIRYKYIYIFKRYMKNLLSIIGIFLFLISPLKSDEKIKKNLDPHKYNFYTGMFDFSDDGKKSALFGIQHNNENLYRESFLGTLSPVTGFMITGDSATYLYTGIEANYDLGKIQFTPSFTPGLYGQGDGKDLGHMVEFKSELQLSVDLFKDTEMGFSYNHLSNASLGDKNPGANSYMFNLLKKF